MRFLQAEYKAIVAVIESTALNTDDFQFVKKKGRVNVKYKEETEAFQFHRATNSQLDASSKLTKSYSYSISLTGQPEIEVGEWVVVLEAFRNWLKSK